MKKLLLVAAGLLLIAGCSSNSANQGASVYGGSDYGTNSITSPGISGGATGTPSGTSNDPLGSGGGPPGGK